MTKLEAARVLLREHGDVRAARYIFDHTDDDAEKKTVVDILHDNGDHDDAAAVARWVFDHDDATD